MSVLKQRPWLRVSICLATIMVMVVPAHAIETAGELFVDLNANSFGDNTDLWTNPGTYTDFELASIAGCQATLVHRGESSPRHQCVPLHKRASRTAEV